VTKDGTGRCGAPIQDPHPAWCDTEQCTVESDHPYGLHTSDANTVGPDKSVRTRIEFRLTQLPGGVRPPLATIEIRDDQPGSTETYPLTPAQVRRLHVVTRELLAAIATS
jgi:hypothetical protein